MVSIKFLGQSCFLFDNGQHQLLFDPYLSKNPAQVASPDEVTPDYILVTHGHADHIGDAVEISNRTGAPVITTPEVGHYLEDKGCRATELLHIGGKIHLPFGFVKATQALHGCGNIPGGVACGFLVQFDGKLFYFAGDTGLFEGMRLLGQYNEIYCSLLPIGDRFTMGPEDAAIAAALLKTAYVIPMHYNGNAKTMQDPDVFRQLVEQNTNSKALIMQPGVTIEL